MPLIVYIIIPIIAILAIGVWFWLRFTYNRYVPKSYTAPQGTLRYMDYTTSGGMDGSYLSVSVRRASDNDVILSCTVRTSGAKRRKDYSRRIADDVLLELEKIVNENDLTSWINLPQREYFVLDKAEETLTFGIDRRYWRIGTTSQWPDDGSAVRQCRNLLIEKARETFRF